ncbi:hypothetical protein [Sanguibacter massiliensis]|uniref:hypothetical protein n=1 Tax=Sanguibacter massiliensis TaxID=1973217 RepID=UPI000C816981|nr:hypothetical protein [Sanguibacter massiliensis]
MSSTDASERPEPVLPWDETGECPVCEAAGAVYRYAYGLVVPPGGMSLEDYGLVLERQRVVLAGCDVRPGVAYVCRACGSTFDDRGLFVDEQPSHPGQVGAARARPPASPGPDGAGAPGVVRRVVSRRSVRSRRRG